jgi:hypothetical protein
MKDFAEAIANEGAQHIELPLAEVHDLHRTQDEGKPRGNHRINAPDCHTVHETLKKES